MDSSLRESAPVVVALADRTSRGMAVKSQDNAALSSPSGPFPPCRPLTIAEVSGWMNESAKDSLASALSVVVPRFLAAFTSRTRQRTRRIIDTDFDPFGWSVARSLLVGMIVALGASYTIARAAGHMIALDIRSVVEDQQQAQRAACGEDLGSGGYDGCSRICWWRLTNKRRQRTTAAVHQRSTSSRIYPAYGKSTLQRTPFVYHYRPYPEQNVGYK